MVLQIVNSAKIMSLVLQCNHDIWPLGMRSLQLVEAVDKTIRKVLYVPARKAFGRKLRRLNLHMHLIAGPG